MHVRSLLFHLVASSAFSPFLQSRRPAPRYAHSTLLQQEGVFDAGELEALNMQMDGLGWNANGALAKNGNNRQDTQDRSCKVEFASPNQRIWDKLMSVNATDDPSAHYFQFTEYHRGDHHDWHLDAIAGGCDVEDLRTQAYIIMVEPCAEGGLLEIDDRPLDAIMIDEPTARQAIKMGAGDVVAFDPRTTLHRVTPVVSGRRRTIVSWAVSTPPKVVGNWGSFFRGLHYWIGLD